MNFGQKKSTLPETNIAGWKIHHFDGFYQDFDGDVHGRTVSFREGTYLVVFSNPSEKICKSQIGNHFPK